MRIKKNNHMSKLKKDLVILPTSLLENQFLLMDL